MQNLLISNSKNKRLADVCTLGIGGPADFFLEIRTISDMQLAITTCHKSAIPFLVIGKGSNCLFEDKGFKGCILQNKIDFFEDQGDGKYYIGAGFSFSLLGVKTSRNGYSGLEFASGIPASVGGAIFMNAGANGMTTKDCLVSVEFVNESGILESFQKEQLNLGYRTSNFQQMKGAIVGATFQLSPSAEARQKQLNIIQYRTKTQPYGAKSAGCIFRNPTDYFAGQLIEQCGLKGLKVGEAEVSSIHGNFLINLNTATCSDFKQLIKQIQETVKNKTGIELESEVRVIPYEF